MARDINDIQRDIERTRRQLASTWLHTKNAPGVDLGYVEPRYQLRGLAVPTTPNRHLGRFSYAARSWGPRAAELPGPRAGG